MKFFTSRSRILNSLWIKFFLCYTIPIVFLVGIWIVHSTVTFEQETLDNLLNYRETLNKQIVSSLDTTARNIQQQSYIIYNNTDNLEALFKGPSTEGYFAAQSSLQKTIDNFLLATKQIDGFAMLDLKGNTIFLHDRTNGFFTSHNSSEDDWYKKTLTSIGTSSDTMITSLDFLGTNRLVVASGKVIYDLSSKERIGVVVAFSYIDTFFQNVNESAMTEGEEIQLLNAYDQVIYSTNMKNIDSQFELLHHENNYDIVSSGTSEMIRTTASSKLYDWSIAAYTPYTNVLSFDTIMKDSNIITFLMIILVSLIVSSLTSLIVTKPLSKLMSSLKKLETGDFNDKSSINGTDEVAKIGNAYKQMLDKIHSLIKEQYELKLAKTQSELEALQSQINPHFLFNTLNSIKSATYDSTPEKARLMIQALSDLMHYSLGHGKYIVSFAEEIATAQKYLYLQNYRFGNRYSIKYDIEDAVMDLEIPRLIIQPLVENSIKHGLEHVTQNGLLIITAKLIDKHVYIYVANNGSRIPTEKLNILNKKFSDFTASTSFSHENIGLMNVCYRLQLHYPNNFGMEMTSTEKFTTTKLVIPAKPYISKTQNECEETP